MSRRNHHKRDTCFYCEREFTFKDYGEGNAVIKTVDHIIPESKGGADKYINTVACCHHCNFLKGGFTMNEFIQKVNSLIERGETYKNIPKESLNTIIRKAKELQQYVEDKGVKLYKEDSHISTI